MPGLNQTAALAATLSFLSIAVLMWGIYRLGSLAASRRRLIEVLRFFWRPPPTPLLHRPTTSSGRTSQILEQLSKLSTPEQGWQNDATKLKFIRAGIDFDRYGTAYYAARTALTFLLPILAYLGYSATGPDASVQEGILVALVLAAAGYYGPEQLLRHLTRRRQAEMRQALPDILDLLVICTESGLSLDQAMSRVAGEIARHSPVAAREIQLLGLSIRAGVPRSNAFRDLALRTELDDLAKFATMVIQAEQFGAGIAMSLRSLSDIMRVRRMQRAEEAAAKLPTKMLAPLALFILPSLFMVILGPAVMGINAMLAN